MISANKSKRSALGSWQSRGKTGKAQQRVIVTDRINSDKGNLCMFGFLFVLLLLFVLLTVCLNQVIRQDFS